MKNLFVKNIMKATSLVAIAASLMFVPMSCIEEQESQIDGKGANRFRIAADEFSVVTFTPNSVETKSALTIFRDANSSASMNQAVTVNMSLDQAGLDAYNTEHETSYVLVPTNAYTLNVNPGSVTFNPGESAKSVRITLNTALLDLSKKYVLPFRISNPSDGFSTSETQQFSIVQMLPINQYDGVYAYTGFVERYSAAGAPLNDGLDGAVIDGIFKELATTGENSVSLTIVWASGGGLGGVGLPLILTVDPATNAVTVTESVPTAANWGVYPGETNYYDPATRTFHIAMKWAAAAPSPSGTTRGFRLDLVYDSPR